MVIWSLLGTIPATYGQETAPSAFIIDRMPDFFEGMHNQGYLLVLEDQKGSLTLEEVQKLPFQKYPVRNEEFFQADYAYWGKITLKSTLSRHTDWFLYVGFDNLIEFYFPDQAGNYQRKLGGQYVPSSQKEIVEGRVSPFNISLAPNTSMTVYIRVENFNQRAPSFYMALVNPTYWHKRLQKRNLVEGLFNGVLLIMIFYNLLLFFSNRDRTYLYYSIYILHVGTYFFVMKGFSREFFLGEYPLSEPYVWVTALGLSPVFYFQFIRHYLHTQRLIPKWDRFIRYAIVASLATLALELLILYFRFDIDLIARISTFILVVETIFSLLLLWRLIMSKNKLAYYLVAGSFCLWVGGLFAIVFLVSSYFFDALALGQAGVVAEVLIFSLGLGYRMKADKHDKETAQQSLIEQLKENERMQAEANRKLEEMVIQRTQEIRAQNRKLEQQKEEIASQKESIFAQNTRLDKTNEKLISINEEKNLLIGIVAHDLRNPLTSALSMAQLLTSEAEEMDQDQKDCISLIDHSLNRMNHMIEHILDVNAIEASRVNLHFEEIFLRELINEVLLSFRETAQKKRISLVAELHHCQVLADRHFLMQVLENLISNAIKFSPTEKEVRVCTANSHQKVSIEVRDQGPGISPEDQKKLFLKYQKLSAQPTAGEKSTGLGLSIVKKYVEAMHGEIICKSALGEGTVFTIEFECHQAGASPLSGGTAEIGD